MKHVVRVIEIIIIIVFLSSCGTNEKDHLPDNTLAKPQTEPTKNRYDSWSLSGEAAYYKRRLEKDGIIYLNVANSHIESFFTENGIRFDKWVNDILRLSKRYIIIIDLPYGFPPMDNIAVLSEPPLGENWKCFFWGTPKKELAIDMETASQIYNELLLIEGCIEVGDETDSYNLGGDRYTTSTMHYHFVTFGKSGVFNRCVANSAAEFQETEAFERKFRKNYDIGPAFRTIGKLANTVCDLIHPRKNK